MSRKKVNKFRGGFTRLYNSANGKRLFPRAMQHEVKFADQLPYLTLQSDDKTILTIGGELIQCVRVEGINPMTASDQQIVLLKQAMAEIVSQAGPRFSFYIHKISRPFKDGLKPFDQEGFAADVDRAWSESRKVRKLRDTSVTISIINRPTGILGNLTFLDKIKDGLKPRQKRKSFEDFTENKAERMAELNEGVGIVRAAFAAQNARVLTAQSGELLGFLESIGTGYEIPTYPSNSRGILAGAVANHRVTFRGKKLSITDGVLPDRKGTLYTIKEYPQIATPGMFDEMNLPVDMVITHSFVAISEDAAIEKMRRELAQRENSRNAAQTEQVTLAEGRDRVASGIESLGYHQMSVAIYSDSDEVLAKAGDDIKQIAQSVGVKMLSESFPHRPHYFAQWPGNATMRVRSGCVSNHVFADMASLHRTLTGLPSDKLPWESPVTIFPTPERSGYRFSFHPEGSPDKEPPAAHTVIFGPSNSGKSVLISFLMAQAQRMGARVFAFDYLRGLEVQIEALGGSYSTISANSPTGLNPLYSETDTVGRMWLSDWLTALVDRADAPLTPVQVQQIHNAVIQTADAPEHLRNFDGFPTLFGHLGDGGDLQQRVKEWAPGGRFGWVFGENKTDNFSLDKNIMGFDLTAVLQSGSEKERTAILGYIFQRLERKLHDRQRTFIVIDEAWTALGTEYFSERLEKWLVTARKQNAVVVMVTQFPSQLQGSKAGSAILQGVQTQILLPNPQASADNFAALNLNERELSCVLRNHMGLHPALVRNNSGSVVLDVNLSPLGEYLTILGGSQKGRMALEKYKSTNGMKVAAE